MSFDRQIYQRGTVPQRLHERVKTGPKDAKPHLLVRNTEYRRKEVREAMGYLSDRVNASTTRKEFEATHLFQLLGRFGPSP